MDPITEHSLLAAILNRAPYFVEGFAEHEAHVRENGGGPVSLLQHVAGRFLDLVAVDLKRAAEIGAELGRIYDDSDRQAKEWLGIGVFEECLVVLRACYREQPEFDERVQLVRSILPEVGRAWYDAWQSGSPLSLSRTKPARPKGAADSE